MLRFMESMDPHSLDVRRDGKLVGMIQVHRERYPRLTVFSDADYLSLDELREITRELEALIKRAADWKPNLYL
jgi:predicted GNAT superfamily acetyltransferase